MTESKTLCLPPLHGAAFKKKIQECYQILLINESSVKAEAVFLIMTDFCYQ